jgi:hypothetical protein
MAKWAHTKVFSVAFFPAAVPPGSSEQLFTVPGVKLGDFVAVNKPTSQAGLSIGGARASAKDQIGLTFSNDSGASITPTQGEFYTILAVTPGDHCHDDHDDCCDDRDHDHCCDDDD